MFFIVQLIFGLYSCKNGIPKTALCFLNNNTSNNITMRLPFSFNSIGFVLKYIILSPYIIGAFKFVTKEYRSLFCLCGNSNHLTVFSIIWFLITPLSTIALKFLFCNL